LKGGDLSKVRDGSVEVLGHAEDGRLLVAASGYAQRRPKTMWLMESHDASEFGTALLSKFIPDRRFPFPKSLYAVEDALRFFVGSKADSTILDFFAGSGTAAHAVFRLNRQDGGRRHCISITNNEVSADEQADLRRQGLRPGDPDWEAWGICDYVTKPRVRAAVEGKTPAGRVIEGEYRFRDASAISEGFEENVEFLTMTYEASRTVAQNRAFDAVAPLLWLRAGSQGRRIETVSDDFDVADSYGILFDLDSSAPFIESIAKSEAARVAFIVTDDDRGFQAVCAELASSVEPVRLYGSYLANFTINTARE